MAEVADGGRSRPQPGRRLPVVGPGARSLLGHIADAEGADEATARAHGYASAYDVLFYGYRPDPAETPLTQMSLDEVDALQGRMGAHTPVGRYQTTRPTLRGLRGTFGLAGSTIFTPQLQDQFARQLMSWRGYDDPQLSLDEVQQRFSHEWASVPTLAGRSVDPAQPVGISGPAFQRYLAASRAMDGVRQDAAPRPAG